MALIANWPDRCPQCRCAEFYVSSRVGGRLVVADRVKARYQPNRVRFTCRDSACAYEWVVDLVSVDPVIFTTQKFHPMAVVASSVEDAQEILALDDDWTTHRLSELITRGAQRAQLTALTAASVMNQTPESQV